MSRRVPSVATTETRFSSRVLSHMRQKEALPSPPSVFSEIAMVPPHHHRIFRFGQYANARSSVTVSKKFAAAHQMPPVQKIRKGLVMLASRTTCLVAVLCSNSDDMPDGWQRTNHLTVGGNHEHDF